MALVGTDRGVGADAVGDTTYTFSPASNFTAGTTAVLCVAVNNSHTNGAAHATFTVTDSLGNTWTRRSSPLFDPGAASAGVEGGIFTTAMSGGTLTTGTTITVTTGAAIEYAAHSLHQVAGTGVTYSAQGAGAGSFANAWDVTTSSVASGAMVIAALFVSYDEDEDAIVEDSDSTRGNWSSQQTALQSASEVPRRIGISSQRKVVTGSGVQDYNPAFTSTEGNGITAWISLVEDAPAADGCLFGIFGRRRGRR
jgi:hypothetical protein